MHEIRDVIEQKLAHFFAQDRMIVPQVVRSESRKEIEIFAAFVIPHARARSTNENPPVPECAKQLDESWIDMSSVFIDGGMIGNGLSHERSQLYAKFTANASGLSAS